MNPWILLGGVAALILAYGSGRFEQHRLDVGSDAIAEQAAQKGADKATEAVVGAIKGLQPKFTTIYKPLEKETRVETRYTDAACSHTPTAWSLLDQAYQAAGGEPFSGGAGVPTPAAPNGP
jgi:hypothetical protein